MNNEKQNKLAEEKVSKLVMSYALTTLIALIFNSVYTLTDSLFVSWGVGDNAMGGVSIIFPFVLLQSAISVALGGGAASLISRKLGKDELAEGGEIALNAMLTFWITAVFTTILGFAAMKPMLQAMGATEELYAYAKDYFTVILIGNVFSTGFSSIIRAEGKMLYGLLIWVIPITLNIILDAIFILVLHWGVKGSAYATVACQFTSFCMSIIFFTKFSKLIFKGAKLKLKTVKGIFSTGLPALVQTLSMSVSLLLINNILKYSNGTLAINTFAYINKIIIFAIMPFVALMQALSPIVGYNFGAGNLDRTNQAVKFSILVSVVYSLIAVVILEAVPDYLIMIFTNSGEIIALGAYAMRIIALSLPFMPLAMLTGAAYQSEGKKAQSLFMYSIEVLLLIPCSLILVKLIGVNGAWWSYVAANILTTIIAFLFIISGKKKQTENSSVNRF